MGNYYEKFDPPYFPDLSAKYPPAPVNLKSYDRDDADILEELKTRFEMLQGIDTSNVETTSKNEIVTLTGDVESDRLKDFIADIAESIPGVRGVINELYVSRSGASQE